MNIGIIGVGGVGGYFGGKLSRLLDTDIVGNLKVYFIARNRHLQSIRQDGLLLSTLEDGELVCRPTFATDDFNLLPELDLCLICVKSYDLEAALASLRDKITPRTQVIALLNGVDAYERIRSVFEEAIVYPACVYIGTQIERDGKVTQNGGACAIMCGPDPLHPETVPQEIFDLFDASGIKYQWLADARSEIWSKYVFIAAYGMVAAAQNKTFGELLENPESSGKILGVMNEIVAVAQKLGVDLPEGIAGQSLEKGHNFPYETKTSFQRDLEQRNKPNEKELYGSTIIRLADSLGVAVPFTRQINDKLGDSRSMEVMK